MKNIKVTRRGTTKIVSSGYSDRYAQSEVWVNLEIDGITLRVNYDEAPTAYMMLAGLEQNDENIRTAVVVVHDSPMVIFARAEIMPTDEEKARGIGRTLKSVSTTSARLNAGIAACTGYPNLNEIGRERVNKLAADLTASEWEVVYSGLDEVNRDHARRYLPIVNFVRQQ